MNNYHVELNAAAGNPELIADILSDIDVDETLTQKIVIDYAKSLGANWHIGYLDAMDYIEDHFAEAV